jgi:hypothetical protein
MDTPAPRLGVGMTVGPILVISAVGLIGIGIAEAISAPPGEFLAGIDWIGAGMLLGLAGSVWSLIGTVVALTRMHDPSRRWALGLCLNLASLTLVAACITVTAWVGA